MLSFLICSCSSILLRLDWSNNHDGYHLLSCASHWAKYFIYIVCNHHEKMARRDLYSRGNWGSKKLINFLKVIKPSGIAGVWTPELVFFSLSDSDAHISWFKSLPLRMNMDWKGHYFLSRSWGTAVPCFREQWTPNIMQQAGWKSICPQCSTQSNAFHDAHNYQHETSLAVSERHVRMSRVLLEVASWNPWYFSFDFLYKI